MVNQVPGIRCPKCGEVGSVVSNTRGWIDTINGVGNIRRHRTCEFCNHRYITIEVVLTDYKPKSVMYMEDAETTLSETIKSMQIALTRIHNLNVEKGNSDETRKQNA